MASNLPFVKFQRGTQAQYDRLKQLGSLESDALYFIYDKNAPNEGGVLYVGETLIGGTGSAIGATSLNGLNDVDLTGVTLSDGMILQYNGTSGKWEAVPGSDLLSSVASGSKVNDETGAQAAARIDPQPFTGDIIFVDNTPYIYNGSSWQLLIGQAIEDRVAALESGLQAIEGSLTTTINNAVNQAVSGLNHLTYTTVSALPAVADAAENTVYLVGNSATSGNDKYEEYMLVNGVFEKVGHFEPDLSNYVTLVTFNSTVSDLQDSIANLEGNFSDYVPIVTYDAEVGDINDLRTATGNNSETIVSGIVDLYGRLTWNELPSTTPDSGN